MNEIHFAGLRIAGLLGIDGDQIAIEHNVTFTEQIQFTEDPPTLGESFTLEVSGGRASGYPFTVGATAVGGAWLSIPLEFACSLEGTEGIQMKFEAGKVADVAGNELQQREKEAVLYPFIYLTPGAVA